ncbi:MAG: gliding motility-associated C-terminal domain-containing protein, partial [Flavobacteriales bacterium]|nr:gliding motility-associated C-terminal domain-containing protein [Flavobacteriales bacterium]
SMSGGQLPFTYNWDDSGAQTTSTATGLIANTYTVNVTDSFGCIVSAAIVIVDPPALSVTTSATDVTCNGICDGSAVVIGIGGTLPYGYQWNDPLLQTNDMATGLCLGTFNVTLTDAKGCVIVGTQAVTEPASIILSETHSDANCGQADGIATVSVTGGTSPYTYLWSNGATTAFVTNVLAGTFIVTVTDVNGCNDFISVTVADVAGPVATILSSDSVTCFGGNDGTATAGVSGGTFPYAYDWDDSLTQITPTAGNLSAGNYVVTIKDVNNCVASAAVTIFEPPAIVFNASSTDPICYDSCDGTATVTVTGGIPSYVYQWDDPGAQTTSVATGLCDGTFNLIIVDANGCIELAAVILSNPTPVTLSSTSTDELCLGSCDGSATAVPSNAQLPYTFSWDDGNNQATATAGSLCAGTYSVVLIDGNGCTSSSSTIVGSPPLLVTSILSSGNVSCFGYCDGYAQSTVTGGTPPYSYLWDDGQTGNQAVGLCAGAYILTVIDSNGCTATTNVTITQPQGMVTTTTQNNVTCNGACDGNATVSLSGGTPPFFYQWDDLSFQTTTVASNLCSGIYGVTVTDINGCVQTASVVITQPQILSLVSTINSSTCGFNNGSACVNVIGGLSPFVIQWNDPATTVGACASNLFAGVYNPIVSDANGCFFTMPVIVNDLTGPTVDSITWTDVTCGGDSNGTATIAASGVAPPYTYIWKEGPDTIGVNVTTVFGLWGATYTVTIIDNNGCIAGAAVTVNEPSPVAAAIISFSGTSCFGVCDGTASVIAGGGSPAYSYLWSDGQTTTSVTGLCAGLNNVAITDANGCTTSVTAFIPEPDLLVVSDSAINPSCNGYNDGAAYLTVQGGTPFYSYSWNPNVGSGPIVTNLTADTLLAIVTDINGCVAVAVVILTEPTPLAATGMEFPSTCSDNNGIAIVTASGGTGPYSYLWDDPLSTTTDSVFDLLERDPYYVQITDANGCSMNYAVTVSDLPGPVLTLNSLPLSCNGDNTGIAVASVTSGNAPFNYTWGPNTGSQTGPTATGLAAGTASVTVTDFFGCTDNGVVVITEPTLLTGTTQGDTTICYNDDKVMITVTALGGTAPYTYVWNNGLDSIPIHFLSPNTTTSYDVEIIDANDCKYTASPLVTITVTPELTVSAVGGPLCSGSGDSLDIEAIISGGNGGPYTYTWIGMNDFDSILTVAPVSDTSYLVAVSDGCSINDTTIAFVTVNPKPEISFVASGGGCAPEVEVTVVSDTTGMIISSWLWDFGDGTTSTSIYAVTHTYDSAGLYDITLAVISNKNCPFDTTSLGVIDIWGDPTADFSINQNGAELDPAVTSILTPNIDFISTSSPDVDSVIWDFGDPESGAANASNLFNPSHMYSDTGTYTVMLVVFTSDGCRDTIWHDVRLIGDYIIFAPNAFTPDGDGDNDYFFPKGIGVLGSTFELYIFDRWGDLIATVTGEWSDDISIGWDGHANQGVEEAQMDVYIWLIRTGDILGGEHEYIGHVTLLR